VRKEFFFAMTSPKMGFARKGGGAAASGCHLVTPSCQFACSTLDFIFICHRIKINGAILFLYILL
jgi:hypothetical protein